MANCSSLASRSLRPRSRSIGLSVAGHRLKPGAPSSKITPKSSLLSISLLSLRRQAAALRIEETPIAPRSPWQNPYAERVIGSIRRECLDHLIVLGERRLRRVLSSYTDNYNGTRTHLSLDKDAPEGRPTHPRKPGRVTERKRVGGLHHEHLRIAA